MNAPTTIVLGGLVLLAATLAAVPTTSAIEAGPDPECNGMIDQQCDYHDAAGAHHCDYWLQATGCVQG